MSSITLKRKLKSKSDLPEELKIRLHRAISWLKCAEDQDKNPDLVYLSLWISFNALYARDLTATDLKPEREKFRVFIQTLVSKDDEKRIYNLLWQKFSGPVRALINNEYLYRTFWDFQRGEISEWRKSFDRSIEEANKSLSKQNIPALLEIVLDRLYTLRNQLMHGGATYKSKINRTQLRDGINMLTVLVPIIIDLLMQDPEEDWGRILYPVISSP
jgi:hypothetical protein